MIVCSENSILRFTVLQAMQVSKMVQNPKIEYQHKPPFMPNKIRPTFRKLVQNCGFFVNGEIFQKFIADPYEFEGFSINLGSF